jgi:hypothetical protein
LEADESQVAHRRASDFLEAEPAKMLRADTCQTGEIMECPILCRFLFNSRPEAREPFIRI